MRISSQQAFHLGVQGIQRNYSEAIKTQQQISTGNRILTPADDPVASVRLMQLEQQQNMLGQYKENLIAANNSLVQEESTLNAVNTIMQKIRDLAGQALPEQLRALFALQRLHELPVITAEAPAVIELDDEELLLAPTGTGVEFTPGSEPEAIDMVFSW